ncbi:RNA-directed DNA polymerase from mobile element jockey [Trichonephila inaurata madagascariensis]|uniref:RNA-directed DNA polymerase from mobile element jockey n=1 Tax=Trichonephila inaurata madagascariensis TaxID=2747483 RepID=A0A8X6WTX7_9ARAC|nr:RNA-directed DNA polymerase from mobile element jockey [Trichonephila inaurata madagascariensis]
MYPDLFLIVFNSCLRLKTFPRCWKKARIILIPKVNAVRVPNLDNLRCISLLSTLGKCFERLIINRVAWRLYKDNYFNKNQFGFMPQKCTEDALVKLNEIVLKGKKRNLHTILVFLDIKGAFDNAWWPGILSLLKRSNIPGNLFAVISSFLKDRSVTLSLGHSSKEKLLNKGCPQGSVSGPFLWNVIINDFLEKILAFSSCETIAFADDLLLCFQGKSFPDLSRQAQFTLDFASTWTKNYKLEFNAVKSKVMILERRENNVLTGNLTLNGFSLDCVKELKYLGIVLDRATYRNYKEFFSIVLLALVDANLKFLFVDVGTNGRVSDGGVWGKSKLKQAITNGDMNIPEAELRYQDRHLNCHLSLWLMMPFR